MDLARIVLTCAAVVFLSGGRAGAESPEVRRGKEALLLRPLLPPAWSLDAYQSLWKQWGLHEPPSQDSFFQHLREQYGLEAAGFPNEGLPMGLQKSRSLLLKGITTNCLLCHG